MMQGEDAASERKLSGDALLLAVGALALACVLFGFVVSGPLDVFRGLGRILTARDTLITDYIGLGGLGAAFVNAGLLTIVVAAIYRLSGAKVSGAAIACLLLVLGFALFGKNLINIWPIVLGVALYSRFKREPFAQHINTAFFGCALAPVVSEILFSSALQLHLAIPLALATGVVMGFVLPPAAAQLFRAHDGFSLYNMGFTAGIVGTLVVAIYKSYGFIPEPVFIWSTGNNLLLGAFVSALFLAMIGFGLALDRQALRGMAAILRLDGRSPSDFIQQAGAPATFVNMGASGLIATAYVIVIGADLNGPVIGAIFSIVGFAAFGKHPFNFGPVMAGVVVGTLAKPLAIASPSIVLAALFGTTLAPIAGRFGWGWGIVAGFIHSSTALTVGALHGGLNLYNNGFAAGIVASALAPVIISIKSRRTDHPPERL